MKHHHVDNSDGSGDEEIGPNIIDLGPVEYPPGEHRLQHPYCLWFSKRPSQMQGSQVLFLYQCFHNANLIHVVGL